jgi:hypothetical protein
MQFFDALASTSKVVLKARSIPAIPRTVWVLGFVSLFMDLSSELVHSLLPVFLVSTLGASVMTVGLIEGVAEAATLIAKVFSGAISDYFRRRKGLILLGYGMAALTKPLFPLATSAEAVFIARFLDRIGKGIRGAPRDALVADVAPPAIRGACFGPSIDGYRWRVSWAIIGDIADVFARQRHQAGVVVRRHTGVDYRLFDSVRNRGPGRHARTPAFPFADSAECAQAIFRRLLVRGGRWGDLHARPIQ